MTPLRIGDAERDRAAADLGEHFAQGRLTHEEYDERLERIWSARTEADLVPVFGDLPGGAYGARPTVRMPIPGRRPRFRAPLRVLLALLLILTVVTHLPLIFFALLIFVLVRRQPWERGSRRFA